MRTLPLLLFVTVLTSCNSTAPAGLPGGATLIREGGGSLSVTAPDNGTLYVRDLRADRIVWEGQVHRTDYW